MKTQSSPIDFEVAFKELDDLLGRHHLSLHIICCGGYLIQRMGFRGTIDVDAFYQSNEEIDLLIRRVGALLDINSGRTMWLNNAVSTMSDWPDPQFCRPLHKFTNLTVDQVTTEYLLGMKLRSIRDRDVDDAVLLVNQLDIKDPLELYSLMHGMALDVSLSAILKVFTTIYGKDWFEKYYKEHAEDILKIFRCESRK